MEVILTCIDQRIGSVAEGTDDMQYVSAKFHFVDLAGSERACRTGNEGARFKGCDIIHCLYDAAS